MATMETLDPEPDDDTKSYGYCESTAKTPKSTAPTAMRGQFASQYRGMKETMLKENLTFATRLKSKKDLQKSIKDYRESGLSTEDCDEFQDASRELSIITLREDLKRAVQQSNAELVRSILEEVRTRDQDLMVERGMQWDERRSLRARLQMELQKANRYLEELGNKAVQSHKLNRAVMTEVSVYSTPPRGVHPTLQALLLLMGEDEHTTGDWQYCARVAHPREFQKRLVKFEPSSCHPELVVRAQQILDGVLYEDILKSSRAGAAFYVFAVGTVDEYCSLHSLDDVSPAKVARQREILDRPWPIDLPKSSKSERTKVERPRKHHKGFNSYKGMYF